MDTKTREVLEQIIDSVIQSTPTLTKAFFDPQAKERLLIQNEKDFLLGMDLGIIQHAFWSIIRYALYLSAMENKHTVYTDGGRT